MLFIEDDNFLKTKQKFYINDVILGDEFSYYFQKVSMLDGGGGDSFLCHIVLTRPEERNGTDGINSPYYNFFKELLETFCQKHNIQINEIFRIAVNLTYNTGSIDSITHVDHKFDHKQLILYLNDPTDKSSNTVIVNDKNEKVREVSPKKYKGFCFDSSPHYLKYPKNGERIIAIFTFI